MSVTVRFICEEGDRDLFLFTVIYFVLLNIDYHIRLHYKANTPAGQTDYLVVIIVCKEARGGLGFWPGDMGHTYVLCWLRKLKLSLPFDPLLPPGCHRAAIRRHREHLSSARLPLVISALSLPSVSALASRLPESYGRESVGCYSQEFLLFSTTSRI